jgi:hypothetical protein
MGGPPHGTALWQACSRLLPPWILHVVQAWGGVRENREGPNYQVLLEGGGGGDSWRVVELVGGDGPYGKGYPQTL